MRRRGIALRERPHWPTTGRWPTCRLNCRAAAAARHSGRSAAPGDLRNAHRTTPDALSRPSQNPFDDRVSVAPRYSLLGSAPIRLGHRLLLCLDSSCCWRRLAAMRSWSTARPAINSDACDAATTVRRARSRSVAHSACQDPSGRSSTLVAAARCRVEAKRRCRSARHGGSAPRAPDCASAAWSTSRRRCPRPARRSPAATAWRRRRRSVPHASVQPTRASPARGDDAPRGVPRH